MAPYIHAGVATGNAQFGFATHTPAHVRASSLKITASSADDGYAVPKPADTLSDYDHLQALLLGDILAVSRIDLAMIRVGGAVALGVLSGKRERRRYETGSSRDVRLPLHRSRTASTIPGGAWEHSHPDRIAANARMYGLNPAPVERCRVLELGCGAGRNLVPDGLWASRCALFSESSSRARPVEHGRGLAAAARTLQTSSCNSVTFSTAPRISGNSTTSSRTGCTHGFRRRCAMR